MLLSDEIKIKSDIKQKIEVWVLGFNWSHAHYSFIPTPMYINLIQQSDITDKDHVSDRSNHLTNSGKSARYTLQSGNYKTSLKLCSNAV